MNEESIVAMNQLVQQQVQSQGWFEHGLDRLHRIRVAFLDEGELCWYIPRGLLRGIPSPLLTGARLAGLPVHPADSSVPPGLGWALPVCSGSSPGCPAHTEPPRQVEHLWQRWAQQHYDGQLVVVRRGAQLPADFLLGDLDGRWYDQVENPIPTYIGTAHLVATNRYEKRDDGALGQVWEVTPDAPPPPCAECRGVARHKMDCSIGRKRQGWKP